MLVLGLDRGEKCASIRTGEDLVILIKGHELGLVGPMDLAWVFTDDFNLGRLVLVRPFGCGWSGRDPWALSKVHLRSTQIRLVAKAWKAI